MKVHVILLFLYLPAATIFAPLSDTTAQVSLTIATSSSVATSAKLSAFKTDQVFLDASVSL